MMISFYKTGKRNQLYYTIHDRQDSFFHNFTLTSIYGQDIQSGKEKVYHFETQREKDKKIREIFRNRLKSAYKVLYYYAGESHYKNLIREYEERQII